MEPHSCPQEGSACWQCLVPDIHIYPGGDGSLDHHLNHGIKGTYCVQLPIADRRVGAAKFTRGSKTWTPSFPPQKRHMWNNIYTMSHRTIGSMYGMYANIWDILMVNVTIIYTIHGSYGCKNGVFNFKRSHPKPPNPSTGFSSVNQLVAAGRAAVKTPEGEEMRAVFLVNTEQCRHLSNNMRDFINKHIFCGSTTLFVGLLLESLILVGLTTVFALTATGESR